MTRLRTSVVVHGHFYQPPREDPWLETVEAQPSAAPYHDWNERVERECYRAVVAARVPGAEGRIASIENLLRRISFDFGPTLLEWLERHAPRTYAAILAADRWSHERLGGHGNAMAQAYHHTILPLASLREKRTEVRWGVRDFEKRFGRRPEGLWLPETALDHETLDVLAQEGIAFTVVAPHQIEPLPNRGAPGLFKASGGRTIALFPYDGSLSHGIAFGSVLEDAAEWARRVGDQVTGASGRMRPLLVAMATDGETYGHHHRFGEMALAAFLRQIQENPGLKIENFSSFLARHPPEVEVRLVEPSSWSCPHGVERWRSDCGCRTNPSADTQQAWRVGLRQAVDWLAGRIHARFEREASEFFDDPWAARDAYGTFASDEPEAVRERLSQLTARPLSPEGAVRALELLEMERHALRLFTSCGWFFDDLAGLEPIQILRYAARALELLQEDRGEEEEGFLEILEQSRSNEDPPRTGRQIFLSEAKPKLPPHLRVGAAAAAWHQVAGGKDLQYEPEVPGFRAVSASDGTVEVTHRRTGRRWILSVSLERPSPATLGITAESPDEGLGPMRVPFTALPESYRVRLSRQIREDVLRRWAPEFSGPEEPDWATALSGAEPYRSAPEETAPESRALLAAVRKLASTLRKDQPALEGALHSVGELAKLHELLGLPIPFDAQTEFHDLLERASPETRAKLSALRGPLGFTIEP